MAIAAIGQICSSTSMAHNLEQCVRLVGKAAAAGAKVLFLPEASDYIATSQAESLALARPVASSPFVTGLQSAAAQHAVAVHVGIHVPVAVPPPPPFSSSSNTSGITSTPTPLTKLLNRTIYITPAGALHAPGTYDKLHLFDYGALRESAGTQAGTAFTPPFASPVGRLGSLICFDLRFPEAALRLAQPPPSSPFYHKTGTDGDSSGAAQVLLYPSAFTVPTGRAHWEVLLRARAVETQSWVVAAAQVGRHNADHASYQAQGAAGAKARQRVSYGRSMVVNPWGRVVLALKGVDDETAEEEGGWEAEEGAVGELGIVDIDLDAVARVRERMPLVRRTDVYPEI